MIAKDFYIVFPSVSYKRKIPSLIVPQNLPPKTVQTTKGISKHTAVINTAVLEEDNEHDDTQVLPWTSELMMR